MSDKHTEIIDKINKSFQNDDPETFLDFCAEDFEWSMVGEGSHKGKDAVRKWMSEMDKHESPEIHNTKVISNGEEAASNGEMSMKNADGENVKYSYCDIYKFQNEKVIELKSFVVKIED